MAVATLDPVVETEVKVFKLSAWVRKEGEEWRYVSKTLANLPSTPEKESTPNGSASFAYYEDLIFAFLNQEDDSDTRPGC